MRLLIWKVIGCFLRATERAREAKQKQNEAEMEKLSMVYEDIRYEAMLYDERNSGTR